MRLELQKLQSIALFFANEAYLTGAAAEQVVLNQQLGLGLELPYMQYLASINEQTAFIGEQIKASKASEDEDEVGKALWKTAKYMDRVLTAVEEIQEPTEALDPIMPHIAQMRQLFGDGLGTLLAIKKNEKLDNTQKNDAAFDLARKSNLFGNQPTMQKLRQLVLDLLINVTLGVQDYQLKQGELPSFPSNASSNP